jgi:hypothetical protein
MGADLLPCYHFNNTRCLLLLESADYCCCRCLIFDAAAAAVEMGADLVPCYHFGNSRLFGWGPKSLEPLARRHRVALGFLKGRWGLPLPLPERCAVMCYLFVMLFISVMFGWGAKSLELLARRHRVAV